MGKISDFERKFRKKGRAVFCIHGILLDFDEIKRGGWNSDSIQNTAIAEWGDGEWECYMPEIDEDFNDTTITKVKRNISQFYRADPAIKSYRKITVK